MFVGRKEELGILSELLEGDDFKACLIYGRRRVGKSELIKEATKKIDGLLLPFEAKEVVLPLNIRALENLIKEKLSLPSYVHFSNLEEAFEAVFSQAMKQKIVLVLDEFSYLPLGGEDGADASLAKVIDKYRNTQCHLKLIVSGSYVDMLEKMIEKNRPLHGRFDQALKIKEFDYYDASLFFPDYSAEEKFKAYACFSGLPYALSLCDPKKSVEENIIRLYCRPDSILDLFVKETVNAEVSKVEGLNSVLALIGRGKRKFSDILSVLGKDARPEYALEKGVGLGILTKVTPINEPDNRKLTFYSFQDNLLHFYYRYILSSFASRDLMGPENYFREVIKEDLETQYLPLLFEEVSKEFLIRKNREGKIKPPFYQIGTYSYNDKTNRVNFPFDVVTKDKTGFTSYECKYRKEPIGEEVAKEEESQTGSSLLPFYRLGYISKTGFTESFQQKNKLGYSLEDFYACEGK